jgi:hypothetical protein
MKQWHKEPSPIRVATSRKQEVIQQNCQADSWTGSHQASSRVFCEDSKNECQGIVEESTCTQIEEASTNGLRARYVGAPVTLRSFSRADWKNKMAIRL